MFDSLRDRLKSTFGGLNKSGRLTEANIDGALTEVRRALLEADVALPVVSQFISSVRRRAIGADVSAGASHAQAVIGIVHEELVKTIGGAGRSLELSKKSPSVVMICGLQGAGKTTTAAKLAHSLKANQKKRVLLSSIDIYRPAAIDQLETLASSVGADFFRTEEGVAPIESAKAAIVAARRKLLDVVIIDTAGRLHIDAGMMNELVDVHAAIGPDETLFVVDAMVGQDAVASAQAFNETLPLTGAIVTKLDGDARGGALLSVRQVTGVPIKFIGVGEGIEALDEFHPDRIASRILGMGDVATLLERVQKKTDKGKAERIQNKFLSGKRFDLSDYRDQIAMSQDVGGIEDIAKHLPDMPNVRLRDLETVQVKLRREMAIIDSMTPAERANPAIIRSSRRARIANGAGVEARYVNQLLRSFEKMNRMSRKLLRKGGGKQMKGLGMGNFPMQ